MFTHLLLLELEEVPRTRGSIKRLFFYPHLSAHCKMKQPSCSRKEALCRLAVLGFTGQMEAEQSLSTLSTKVTQEKSKEDNHRMPFGGRGTLYLFWKQTHILGYDFF